MNNYIDFIEKFYMEKRFYCRIRDIYNKNEWEISWERKSAQESSWRYKKSDASEWSKCSKSDLYKSLSFHKIDVFQFESELQSKIKNMIVFSNIMQNEAKKLLGDNIVEVSLSEYEKFAKSLVETIRQFLPEKKRKGEKLKNPTPEKPRLKLVSRESLSSK